MYYIYRVLFISFFLLHSLHGMNSQVPDYVFNVIQKCEQGKNINKIRLHIAGTKQPVLHYALYRACRKSEEQKSITQVIKKFLEYKADPVQKNAFGDTALHVAIQSDMNRDVLELFLKTMDLNTKNSKDGTTPLLFSFKMLLIPNAEYKNMIDIFTVLLEHNVNPCIPDKTDATLFHYIALSDSLDPAELVLCPNENQKKYIFTTILIYSKHEKNYLNMIPREILFKILNHSLPYHLKHYLPGKERTKLRTALKIAAQDIRYYENIESMKNQEEPKVKKGNTAQGIALEKGNKELAKLFDPNNY